MINKYIHPNQKYIWIPLAVIIKMLLGIYLWYAIQNPNCMMQTFAMGGFDTFSYFGPFDNLIENGNYDPFYRMPGVGFLYFLFRLIFTKQISHSFFVLFQIVFDALACYLLSKLAHQLTKSKIFFLITFILSITNSYFSVYNIWLLSESICTSALILSVYFFYQAIQHKHQKGKSFLFCGLFITWAVFCRPIYAPVLCLYILLFIFYLYKGNKKSLLKSLLIFSFPFLLSETVWVYAGYQHTQKFYFFQHSSYKMNRDENKKHEAYSISNWEIELINYVEGFGGDVVWWNPNAEISWFEVKPDAPIPPTNIKRLPYYAFTDYFNEDSILLIKKNIVLLNDSSTRKLLRDSIINNTDQTLIRFTKNFRETKPLHYHLLSRLIILKRLLFHQPTYNLYFKPFAELSYLNKGIKVFYFLVYYVYLFGFFFSFIFIFLNRKIYLFLPIVLLAFYGIFIYPYLRFCEYRYIVPVIPLLLFLSSYTIYSFLNLFSKENGKNTLFRFKRAKPTG